MQVGLLLAGCLPIKSTIQPQASFLIVDQHHHPIDNATVMLVGMHLPSKLDSKFIQLQTSNGRTQIEKQVKWQIGSPFLHHGIAYYSWRACAKKTGYPFSEVILVQDNSDNTLRRIAPNPASQPASQPAKQILSL